MALFGVFKKGRKKPELPKKAAEETIAFLKKYKLDKKFSFIPTGGGEMLEFLAGRKLPGIRALK
jgi:hypothetical protein